MLPAPDTFDGFIAGMPTPEARLGFLKDFSTGLEVLYERAGRARALLALELHERERSYAKVADVLGVTRSRAAQLVQDGRLWRRADG